MLSYVEITSVLLGTVGADEHTQTLAVVVPIWRFDCLFYAPPPPTPPPPQKKMSILFIFLFRMFFCFSFLKKSFFPAAIPTSFLNFFFFGGEGGDASSFSYPTNNALLINFRLSSDAGILLTSTDWAHKFDGKRAKTCMHCVHIPTELPFCIPPLVVGYAKRKKSCFASPLSPPPLTFPKFARSLALFNWRGKKARKDLGSWRRGRKHDEKIPKDSGISM